MAQNSDQPERPRLEPEIIPPDRARGQNWPPYGYSRAQSTHRIYVTRMGPLGFALMMLVIGLLLAVFLIALVGAALIWIPVVAAIALIAFFSRAFRR
jgi:hypothetical protein